MYRTPRDIETKFRKNIGSIVPYMCLVDVASQDMMNNKSQIKIKDLIKEHGHKRLSIDDLELQKMIIYVNLAHIAFINSRSDGFCRDLIKYNKTISNFSQSYNIESVDILRRAVFLMHARKTNLKDTTTSLSETIYGDYIGKTELKIVDYFREMRNIEFHGGLENSQEEISLNESDLSEIQQKYKHKPNGFNCLSVRDVILYSQAWQQIAINLCQRLIDIDDTFIKNLCAQYSKCSSSRRDNAITRKLHQDYLQNQEIIDKLRKKTNGWIA